ncbi:MAG: DivIVA domain-containing protein [Bifidobacteriaceae bacterium]|jgi:DivIVA domain-containing protein|nr:DivIVA domain-containing protein [Bifidobacteriaceae bacterium]
MAQLTADDVVLKKFQPTKFREGYDQVEVDDFLDEVALAMRALAEENAELKAKLAAAEARVAELEAGAAAAPPAIPAPLPAPAPVPVATPAPIPVPEPEPIIPPAPAPAPAPAAPAVPFQALRDSQPESATAMLALAQKLHDEYVRAGQEEGEQILTEAKTKAAGIVREAEETSARTMSRLEQDRAVLERKIDELRIFERDYRTRLRTYLENLLADIDGKVGSGEVPAAA